MRQVHLGKGKLPNADGSALADHLRPIAVTSIWWRIVQGARFRHPDFQQWLIRAIPTWVYGGVPGRGVEDAIAPLLIKEYEQSILATLDLTKAFDFANPVLVWSWNIWVWPHKRPNSCNMLGQTRLGSCSIVRKHFLLQVWFFVATRRCVQYAGNDCFPYSDSKRIEHLHPHTTQSLYVDDRSFACSSIAELLSVRQIWHDWTTRLGLCENMSKKHIFHRNTQVRRELVRQGVPTELISTETTILGFAMMPAQRRRSTTKEAGRIQEATVRAKRCSITWQSQAKAANCSSSHPAQGDVRDAMQTAYGPGTKLLACHGQDSPPVA